MRGFKQIEKIGRVGMDSATKEGGDRIRDGWATSPARRALLSEGFENPHYFGHLAGRCEANTAEPAPRRVAPICGTAPKRS